MKNLTVTECKKLEFNSDGDANKEYEKLKLFAKTQIVDKVFCLNAKLYHYPDNFAESFLLWHAKCVGGNIESVTCYNDDISVKFFKTCMYYDLVRFGTKAAKDMQPVPDQTETFVLITETGQPFATCTATVTNNLVGRFGGWNANTSVTLEIEFYKPQSVSVEQTVLEFSN